MSWIESISWDGPGTSVTAVIRGDITDPRIGDRVRELARTRYPEAEAERPNLGILLVPAGLNPPRA